MIYDEIGEYPFWANDLILVILDGRRIFIDIEGQESIGIVSEPYATPIITPCRTEEMQELNEKGFAGFKLNGKWGIVNWEGSLIVPCEYDEVDITDSYRAKKDNCRYTFDSDGHLLSQESEN